MFSIGSDLSLQWWRQLLQLVVYADGFAGRGTDALAEMPCCALRRLAARRVRLRGGWTATRRRTRPISKANLATPVECTNRRAGQQPQLGARAARSHCDFGTERRQGSAAAGATWRGRYH